MWVYEVVCCWRLILGMVLQEKLMINTLQFNLSVPTPYVFMRRFLKAAQSDNEVRTKNHVTIELIVVYLE